MIIHHDPDEWETVVIVPAWSMALQGGCGVGTRRRSPEEVIRIKEERRRKEEEDILRKADEIRARRGGTP